nr:uncharacterized protein LOC102070171 [Zonotrichia albicollis]
MMILASQASPPRTSVVLLVFCFLKIHHHFQAAGCLEQGLLIVLLNPCIMPGTTRANVVWSPTCYTAESDENSAAVRNMWHQHSVMTQELAGSPTILLNTSFGRIDFMECSCSPDKVAEWTIIHRTSVK